MSYPISKTLSKAGRAFAISLLLGVAGGAASQMPAAVLASKLGKIQASAPAVPSGWTSTPTATGWKIVPAGVKAGQTVSFTFSKVKTTKSNPSEDVAYMMKIGPMMAQSGVFEQGANSRDIGNTRCEYQGLNFKKGTEAKYVYREFGRFIYRLPDKSYSVLEIEIEASPVEAVRPFEEGLLEIARSLLGLAEPPKKQPPTVEPKLSEAPPRSTIAQIASASPGFFAHPSGFGGILATEISPTTYQQVSDALVGIGYTIKRDDGSVARSPIGPSNGLGLSEYDVKQAAAGYPGRIFTYQSDFYAAYDQLFASSGIQIDTRKTLESWLSNPVTRDSTKEKAVVHPRQKLASFVRALADGHKTSMAPYFDSIQMLVISNVINSSAHLGLRKALAGNGSSVAVHQTRAAHLLDLFASQGAGGQPAGSTPIIDAGLAEDMASMAISEINELSTSQALTDKIAEAVNKVVDKAGISKSDSFNKVVKSLGDASAGFKNMLNGLNILSQLSKYALLMEALDIQGRTADGQPLIRRLDTSAGNEQTMICKVTVDATKVANFLKENRLTIIQFTGLDLDQFKSGPMGDVETSWKILSPPGSLVYTKGFVDLSKVKTDDNGEAKVLFQGVPRKKALTEATAKPVNTEVPIYVETQIKGTAILQDLFDSIGVAKGGPAGAITALTETLARMKIWGGKVIKLPVRDFTERTDWAIDIDLSFSGTTVTWNEFGGNRNLVKEIRRSRKLSMPASVWTPAGPSGTGPIELRLKNGAANYSIADSDRNLDLSFECVNDDDLQLELEQWTGSGGALVGFDAASAIKPTDSIVAGTMLIDTDSVTLNLNSLLIVDHSKTFRGRSTSKTETAADRIDFKDRLFYTQYVRDPVTTLKLPIVRQGTKKGFTCDKMFNLVYYAFDQNGSVKQSEGRLSVKLNARYMGE